MCNGLSKKVILTDIEKRYENPGSNLKKKRFDKNKIDTIMNNCEKIYQAEEGGINTFKQLIDIHQFIMKYEIVNEFLKQGYPDLVQEPTKEFRERNILHYRELLINNMLNINVKN